MKLENEKYLEKNFKLLQNDNIRVAYTFWGNRVIKTNVDGKSIPIDKLSHELFLFASKNCAEADPNVRLSGIKITQKIQEFYSESDKLIFKTNPITIIFILFRQIFMSYHRKQIMNGTVHDYFCAYSQNEYIKTFNRIPSHENIIGNPTRIVVSKQDIEKTPK